MMTDVFSTLIGILEDKIMFKIDDMLRYIPAGGVFYVNGVDKDFITVEDSDGESHTVMPEDYDKYEKLA